LIILTLVLTASKLILQKRVKRVLLITLIKISLKKKKSKTKRFLTSWWK